MPYCRSFLFTVTTTTLGMQIVMLCVHVCVSVEMLESYIRA